MWNQSFLIQNPSSQDGLQLDHKLMVQTKIHEFEAQAYSSQHLYQKVGKNAAHSPNITSLSFAKEDYYAQGLGPKRNSRCGKKSFATTNADLTYNENENLNEFSQIEGASDF